MQEIHSIPPVYPVSKPNKFIRDQKKQSNQRETEEEKNNEEEQLNEDTAVKHIDEIV